MKPCFLVQGNDHVGAAPLTRLAGENINVVASIGCAIAGGCGSPKPRPARNY
jgi:hypothetical protein